jgi:hypothetical protein
MSNSIILRRCATLTEAQICVGLLNSHDIWAALDNAEHAALDWGMIPALGGVHVRVARSDYERAKQTIIDSVTAAPDLLSAAAGPYEPPRRNRRWRALSMLVIWFGLLNLVAGYALYWLDQIIPRAWVPDPQPSDAWFAIAFGRVAAPPGPGLEGFVFLILIGLFLVWELLTTQPTKPAKEPQI